MMQAAKAFRLTVISAGLFFSGLKKCIAGDEGGFQPVA